MMKFKKTFFFFILFSLFVLALFFISPLIGQHVYAQTSTGCSSLGGTLGVNGVCYFPINKFPIVTNCTAVNSTVTIIVNVLFSIAGLLFFVMIVVAGIEWVVSGGDEEKKRNAQNRLIHAIVGIAIVAGSFLIFELILNLFGVGGSIFSNPIVKTTGTCQLQ